MASVLLSDLTAASAARSQKTDRERTVSADVWYIPVNRSRVLIYAPFHGISTLVNRAMAAAVSVCLEDASAPIPAGAPWIEELRKEGNRPDRKCGVPDPCFLGLVPTRDCMMHCAYCDFAALQAHPVMSFDLIRRAVDGYAEVMRKSGAADWNIHFFGGEPFAAFKEVFFAVNYARRKAEEAGVPVRFEVTTNGFYSEEKARWIAENTDTVVLSLDGFPDSQNRQRPGSNGRESFQTVCRSADIFSKGPCELIIRSCISAENVEELAAWAAFLADRWTVGAVCLEPMIESAMSRKNGLMPPDPLFFARQWASAQRILKAKQIPLVYSSGDISECRNSLCPVGRDALIVDPEGQIGSCWQLAENRQTDGSGRYFGYVSSENMRIDEELLEQQRATSEENRESCRGCFCYAHCAGGCVLTRERNGDFCCMTKILTLWQLLDQLGCRNRSDEILENEVYRAWVTKQTDFRDAGLECPDTFPMVLSPYGTESWNRYHSPKPKELPPLPSDSAQGWFRDGSRIIIADTSGLNETDRGCSAADAISEQQKYIPYCGSSCSYDNFVQVLEGDESLKFQLDHSGMNKSDIEMVWSALREGSN